MDPESTIADRIFDLAQNCIRCTDSKSGCIWIWDDKTRLWKESRDVEIMKFIRRYYRHVQLSDEKLAVQEERDRLGLLLDSVAYCGHLIRRIMTRCLDPDFIHRIDTNNDLLPVLGGLVIDLCTGEVRERVMEDYFSFECPVHYDPMAHSPVIDTFLDDITLKQEDLKECLQSILGRCLTGQTHPRQMYIFWGEGNNAKSTLLSLAEAVLGKFYIQAPEGIFIGINDLPAELCMKRLAVLSEPETSATLSKLQVQAFTNNDHIKAKPFLVVNHKPKCSLDSATWSQVVLIPFQCQFVEKEELAPNERRLNRHFAADILKDEQAKSAFLNWLLVGARRMYASPLILPAIVVKATEDYKSEQDIYGQFIADHLTFDPEVQEQARDIYLEFCDWCTTNKIMSPPNFQDFDTNMEPYHRDCDDRIYLGYRRLAQN